MSEPFSVVLRKASPLSKRKALRIRDLKDETILLIDRNISPGVYDRTLALFRDYGVEPNTVQTATISGDEGGSILVDSGKGVYIAVGLTPIHPAFTDRLITLPLNEPSAFTEIHVVWRKDEQSKTILEFVRFTREAFEPETGLVWEYKQSCLTKALKPDVRAATSRAKKS